MMLFLQSLMSERRQANLSCSSGFPIIKTPDATSDETPVVRELPLVIFCEFVTADVLLLLSLWGQLDTVLSRWNKWDKGRCPCTYFIRSFLVSSFIPSFSKAFTAILFSHLTILPIERSSSYLPYVTTDFQTGKIPLYTLANTSLWVIVMSHPVLARVTWVAWVISGDSSHPAPPGYLLSLPCAPELASSDWSFTLFFALTWYLYDSPHLSLDVQNIMHFSWRKKIWSTSRRVLWNKRFRSNLSPDVPELRVWGIALF